MKFACIRAVAMGAAGISMLGFASPGSCEDVVLQAHRAFYAVSLAAVRSEGDIVGASGAMEITLGKACDGWHMSQRFVLDLEAAAGNVVRQDLSFAAWESQDSRQYRFTARERFGEDATSYHGTAETNSGLGRASFTMPDDRAFPLPKGVLFPVSHTRAIIRTATQGANRIAVPVFDGAVGKGAQETVTFIGTRIDDAVPGTLQSPLLKRPGWRIRTAYFDPDSSTAAPEFEVGLTQLDNGVATGIRLDYTSFSLRLLLTRIEALPDPDC